MIGTPLGTIPDDDAGDDFAYGIVIETDFCRRVAYERGADRAVAIAIEDSRLHREAQIIGPDGTVVAVVRDGEWIP